MGTSDRCEGNDITAPLLWYDKNFISFLSTDDHEPAVDSAPFFRHSFLRYCCFMSPTNKMRSGRNVSDHGPFGNLHDKCRLQLQLMSRGSLLYVGSVPVSFWQEGDQQLFSFLRAVSFDISLEQTANSGGGSPAEPFPNQLYVYNTHIFHSADSAGEFDQKSLLRRIELPLNISRYRFSAASQKTCRLILACHRPRERGLNDWSLH